MQHFFGIMCITIYIKKVMATLPNIVNKQTRTVCTTNLHLQKKNQKEENKVIFTKLLGCKCK